MEAKQLQLQKQVERSSKPDGWIGNAFRTYGRAYVCQLVPTTIKGEFVVKFPAVNENEINGEVEPENN